MSKVIRLNDETEKKVESLMKNDELIKSSYSSVVKAAVDMLHKEVMKEKSRSDKFGKDVKDITFDCGEIADNDKVKIHGKELTYYSCPVMEFSVASNGGKDGDWGHDGRTMLSFGPFSAADGYAELDFGKEKLKIDADGNFKFTLLLGGECEANILRDFFKEAYKIIDEAILKGDVR